MKLNIEQRKIIELEPSGHSLIKGVAGSGKTTVAIHRLSFLQEYYCPEEEDSILLVTFNKTLLNFIKYQYYHLESTESEELLGLFSTNGKVHMQNIDKLMFAFFKDYQKRNKVHYQIAAFSDQINALQRAILKLKETYPDIKLLSPKYSSFLLDEIDWIQSCDIPDLETYQEIDRIGRASGSQANSPQKLNKNSQTRAAIYDLMELYSQLLLNKKMVDFKTMNKLSLQEAAEHDHPRYTHIIIDESQDLSKVQLKFIKQLHAEKSYASIMFVADNTQSIYSHSWLGKGRPYTTLGYDMSGKSRTLSKNYRTTTEISKAAYGLIENDEQIKGNVDFVKPSLIDRHGHAPIYRFFANFQQHAEYYVNEIKELTNDYALRDICIVAKEKRLIESAAVALDKAGIPCELLAQNEPHFEQDTVKLTTMHSIKGLEFKVVFLIHLDEDVIPNTRHRLDNDDSLDSEERKLLYVGMTRANELLYMTSVKRPSKFIKEIDNQALRMIKDASFHPFQSIAIQDYKLTDKVVDVNAKEEVVRQWMMKELNETFGYPLELLQLEYPVQQFSKRGYVDIAVTIEHKGEKIPYIFAEIKSFASPIDVAMEQLKSYMMASTHVRYGIVTNGIEVKIIDRNGERVSDVPPCQPQFLPATKKQHTYMDLRHQVSYRYLKDKEDETIVEVVDPTTNLTLEGAVDLRIPIIGDVAAGIPTTAIEQYEDSVLLMENWVIQPQHTFALKVTGDSMIGAGIDKGDLVIVHKQESVSNGDIVIALIDQEATMKKFMLMGSSVLLISENPNYEPIQMNAEDVVINGKVIGVLKK
ncbi:transcriptional repressor LexA [Carnobacterium sp. FSL W8-0810]|uniref:transcriptional repressor LexA n=1 Tax=Carnobacterium sp. FSL W8-0810 TaxID=2954705 RepID=UPI0030FBC1B9